MTTLVIWRQIKVVISLVLMKIRICTILHSMTTLLWRLHLLMMHILMSWTLRSCWRSWLLLVILLMSLSLSLLLIWSRCCFFKTYLWLTKGDTFYKLQCKNTVHHFPHTIHLFPIMCIILSYVHRIIRLLHLRGGKRGRTVFVTVSSVKGRRLPLSLRVRRCPVRTLPLAPGR